MKSRKQKRIIDSERHLNRAIRARKRWGDSYWKDNHKVRSLMKTKKPCSCMGCSTSRKYYGKTVGERKDLERTEQAMKEFGISLHELGQKEGTIMKTVFLGGSCDYKNYYDWRQEYFDSVEGLDLFNPYVSNWDDAARANEEKHRLEDDYLLFTIAGPNLFSIAEVVDESNKRPETVFAVIDYFAIKGSKFKEGAFKGIEKILTDNGVKVFHSHQECIDHLNSLT